MSLTNIIKQATNNFSLKKLSRGISARSIGYTAALFLAAAAPNFSCTTEQENGKQSSYGCTMDNDCKGDRVCVEGDCVSPSGMNERDAGRQYEDNGNIVEGDAVEDTGHPQDTGRQYEDTGHGEDAGTEPICIDNDEDGFYLTENCGTSIDCNDNAGEIYFGAQEICDTIDNNCDGQVDENCPCVGEETQECGTTDIGECQYGTQTCDIDGKWGECSGNVEPVQEACDGLDNDCNGRVDEIFNNFGEICSAGVGECEREGEYVCSDNGLSTVCNAVPGRAGREICDTIDNNCDGQVDENCPCVGGDTQECGTTDIGECQYGTQTCDINGRWGECGGNVEPIQEICDSLDNDCNGRVDEIFNNLDEVCSAGVGECERQGEYVCSNNGLSTVCNAVPGRAGREVCDGLDNDCNGRVDEVFNNLDEVCSAGVGECESEGEYVCSNNGLSTVCNAVPGRAGREVCDGLDNDCNGRVDEGFNNLGEICSAGVGECERQGEYICSDNGLSTVCNAVPGRAGREVCDGLDNDCNGRIDDGVLSTFYRDRDGDRFGDPNDAREACMAPRGYVVDNTDCNDNNRNINPNARDICDRIDNDCSGIIDDNYVEAWGQSCINGEGECEREGVFVCGDDLLYLYCNAVPGEPQEEICDGLDNDCNGMIDQGRPYARHDSRECGEFNGESVVYWVNSCGEREELAANCRYDCIDGQCINDRFTDIGDGTIRDNQTHRIWEKNPPPEPITIIEASNEYCSNLVLGGSDWWIIPTRAEASAIGVVTDDPDCWRLSPIFGGPCDSYWTITSCGEALDFTFNVIDYRRAMIGCISENERAYIRCIKGQ